MRQLRKLRAVRTAYARRTRCNLGAILTAPAAFAQKYSLSRAASIQIKPLTLILRDDQALRAQKGPAQSIGSGGGGQ
eukprot:IDg17614t1